MKKRKKEEKSLVFLHFSESERPSKYLSLPTFLSFPPSLSFQNPSPIPIAPDPYTTTSS